MPVNHNKLSFPSTIIGTHKATIMTDDIEEKDDGLSIVTFTEEAKEYLTHIKALQETIMEAQSVIACLQRAGEELAGLVERHRRISRAIVSSVNSFSATIGGEYITILDKDLMEPVLKIHQEKLVKEIAVQLEKIREWGTLAGTFHDEFSTTLHEQYPDIVKKIQDDMAS